MAIWDSASAHIRCCYHRQRPDLTAPQGRRLGDSSLLGKTCPVCKLPVCWPVLPNQHCLRVPKLHIHSPCCVPALSSASSQFSKESRLCITSSWHDCCWDGRMTQVLWEHRGEGFIHAQRTREGFSGRLWAANLILQVVEEYATERRQRTG